MRDPLKLAKWLILGLIAFALVVFAVVNSQDVVVSFGPFYQAAYPLSAVFVVFFLLGLLLGGIMVWFSEHKNRKASSQRKRLIRDLEKEIDELKAARVALESQSRKQIAPPNEQDAA